MSRRGINESERFQVEVYCRRGKGEYQCLGFCGASTQDVLIGETDSEYLQPALLVWPRYLKFGARERRGQQQQRFLPQRLCKDLQGRCLRLLCDHTIGK